MADIDFDEEEKPAVAETPEEELLTRYFADASVGWHSFLAAFSLMSPAPKWCRIAV